MGLSLRRSLSHSFRWGSSSVGDARLRAFEGLDGLLKLPPEVLHLLSFSIFFLIEPLREGGEREERGTENERQIVGMVGSEDRKE